MFRMEIPKNRNVETAHRRRRKLKSNAHNSGCLLGLVNAEPTPSGRAGLHPRPRLVGEEGVAHGQRRVQLLRVQGLALPRTDAEDHVEEAGPPPGVARQSHARVGD